MPHRRKLVGRRQTSGIVAAVYDRRLSLRLRASSHNLRGHALKLLEVFHELTGKILCATVIVSRILRAVTWCQQFRRNTRQRFRYLEPKGWVLVKFGFVQRAVDNLGDVVAINL